MTAAGRVVTTGHVPVLLGEVLAALAPRDGAIYVDGTFGGGGYSRALLEAADCTVWAIDRDPEALDRGADLADRFAGRLHLVAGSFGAMDALMAWGHVVYLEAPLAVLAERVGEGKGRPVWSEAAERLTLREPVYRLAHQRVDATRPPEQVVAAILAAL